MAEIMTRQMNRFAARSIMLKVDEVMDECEVSIEVQQKINKALHVVFDDVSPGWDHGWLES